MRNKAIEKRVDSLLNQSPKALAAMASQITDDILDSVMKGGDIDEEMKAITEFVNRYVNPLDARTYDRYKDEYSLLREHYWMNMWLKAEMRLAESRRDYLAMLKVSLTFVRATDHIREYTGTPPSDTREKFDVDEGLAGATAALETAETTVREWQKPDIWQLIGHEAPVAIVRSGRC